MNKLKVSFFLKGDKTKNGLTAIYGKIKLGTTSCTFSTGKYIVPDRWEKTNYLKNANRIDAEASLKEYIYSIPLQLEKAYTQIIKHSDGIDNITATDLKNKCFDFQDKKEHQTTLLEVLNNHNKFFKMKVAKGERAAGSEEKYIRMEGVMKNFLKEEYHLKDIQLDKISREFVFGLDAYLRFKKKNGEKKGLGNNTTVKYIRNISAMVNHSVRRGFIKENPFRVYDGNLKDVDTVYLTAEELEKIEQKKIPIRRLEIVKDIFLFSCYTSYAPIDAMNLTRDNIEVDADGDSWIKTKRQKTNTRSNVIIIPPLQRIIDKYKNDPECAEQQRLIPSRSNTKMNVYLKELADLCGIQKNLTWYVSRHTFATTVALANGVPIEVVADIMGHKKITQTQHYAKILDSSIKRHMKNLGEKFN